MTVADSVMHRRALTIRVLFVLFLVLTPTFPFAVIAAVRNELERSLESRLDADRAERSAVDTTAP